MHGKEADIYSLTLDESHYYMPISELTAAINNSCDLAQKIGEQKQRNQILELLLDKIKSAEMGKERFAVLNEVFNEISTL